MSDTPAEASPRQSLWLVYMSLIIAGIVFLGDAYGLAQMDRWTARIGIALVWSAITLLIGNGRAVGYVAATITWAAVVLIWFV